MRLPIEIGAALLDRTLKPLGWAALVLLLTVACRKAGNSPECSGDDDCDPGGVCTNGSCEYENNPTDTGDHDTGLVLPSDLDTDSDGDTDADSDTDADGDVDADADADTDISTVADTDTDSDTDSDADTDTDTDTDTDADMDSDTDTDTDTDTYVPPNYGPWKTLFAKQLRGEFTSILGFSKTEMYIGGYNADDGQGIIVHFDGSNVEIAWSFPESQINQLWGTSSTDLYASQVDISKPDRYVILHYDGVTWTEVLTESYALSIGGTAPDDVYATTGNTVYHYDGLAWSEVWCCSIEGDGDFSPELFSIWGASSDDVYFVGWKNGRYAPDEYAVDTSFILHFDGDTWRELGTSVEEVVFRDIWGISSDEMYLCGLEGLMGRFDYIAKLDGLEQSPMLVSEEGSGTSPMAIWANPQGEVFVVGNYISHYDGESWSSTPSPSLYDIWGADTDNLYTVGEVYIQSGHSAIILKYQPE